MQFDPHIDAEGLEILEYEALIPLYEEALDGDSNDLSAIQWLGHAYTRTNRHADGLEMDLRLVALLPDEPVARYNLGCSFALLGRHDEAFESLDQAVRLGYRDPTHYREDADLASLREDPRFAALMRTLEESTGD